jgi:hypothetical protein
VRRAPARRAPRAVRRAPPDPPATRRALAVRRAPVVRGALPRNGRRPPCALRRPRAHGPYIFLKKQLGAASAWRFN